MSDIPLFKELRSAAVLACSFDIMDYHRYISSLNPQAEMSLFSELQGMRYHLADTSIDNVYFIGDHNHGNQTTYANIVGRILNSKKPSPVVLVTRQDDLVKRYSSHDRIIVTKELDCFLTDRLARHFT